MFDAVVGEVRVLLGVEAAGLARYEANETATVMATEAVAERRGELTPEYARALFEELRRAEAAPSWAEHPGLLVTYEPPLKELEPRPGFRRGG